MVHYSQMEGSLILSTPIWEPLITQGLLKYQQPKVERPTHRYVHHSRRCSHGRGAGRGVKIVFIYHVSYGSLLVRCHLVVNKGCRLLPSALVAVPAFAPSPRPVFAPSSRSVFAPSSRPAFGIRTPCVRSSYCSSSKTRRWGWHMPRR